jgi:L-ribulose-5-phosphate 4-epimerase
MKLAELRDQVYRANMDLHRSGLVLFTFGNVSGIDRPSGTVVIKPSGVAYEELSPAAMVCVSLATGDVVGGNRRPSSDTATHVELYRAFEHCGGIVHTHSRAATACAQAGVPIRCMGTTHADYFRGDIPVTRTLSEDETRGEYERAIGKLIVDTFAGIDPRQIPAVLVAHHGPFAWGADVHEAVYHAVILEQLAEMERDVRVLNPGAARPPRYLVDKHYLRKHGDDAYYGQR